MTTENPLLDRIGNRTIELLRPNYGLPRSEEEWQRLAYELPIFQPASIPFFLLKTIEWTLQHPDDEMTLFYILNTIVIEDTSTPFYEEEELTDELREAFAKEHLRSRAFMEEMLSELTRRDVMLVLESLEWHDRTHRGLDKDNIEKVLADWRKWYGSRKFESLEEQGQ